MTDRQETTFSAELPSFRKLIAEAKAHRLILREPSGRTIINVNVLVAIILTVIVPEVAAIIAIVALFKQAKVDIVRPDATNTE